MLFVFVVSICSLLSIAVNAALPSSHKITGADVPPSVLYFDLDVARQNEHLDYAELALIFSLQGLVNQVGAPPTLLMNAGFLNFDWPLADEYWRDLLENDKRVHFVNVTSTLCSLVQELMEKPGTNLNGAVLYENALPYGTGYTLAMATTIASQQRLVPMTLAMRQAHACLATLPIKKDLRIQSMPQMANRSSAWRWAIDELLPHASKNRIFNLYHFDPIHYKSDPQSNATLGNLDLAVQNNAFVMDLNPADPADAALMQEIFSSLDPLFDAYGWAHDEHAWTEQVSIGGGVVFCSFASPNLSFWALLALPDGRSSARRLPSGDSGAPLDKSKYYVSQKRNCVGPCEDVNLFVSA